MSMAAVAVGGAVASAGLKYVGQRKRAKGASNAARAQAEAARKGIKTLRSAMKQSRTDLISGYAGAEEAASGSTDAAVATQRGELDRLNEMMKPYIDAGRAGLSGLQNLIGLGGQDAQKSAIGEIEGGAEFGALTRSGENAILQNASATGGLRGGNVQRSLSGYREELLSSLINRQVGRYENLSAQGLNASTTSGQIGAGIASRTSELQTQGGSLIAQLRAQRGVNLGTLSTNTATQIAELRLREGGAVAGGNISAGMRSAAPFEALGGLAGQASGFAINRLGAPGGGAGGPGPLDAELARTFQAR